MQKVPCGFASQGYYVKMGESRLTYGSWRSLKKRLLSNGFMVRQTDYDDHGRRELELRFSV